MDTLAHSSTSAHLALTMALRDFFLARTAEDLARSLSALPGQPMPDTSALIELEYEFNRLFTGPAPPQAPPYASVYLEREPCLMGASTQQIAQLQKALGLENSLTGTPADFIGLELETWLALEGMTRENRSEDIEKARRFFLAHMGQWIPLFTRRMRGCQLSPIMAKTADLLDDWLKNAKETI